ncbi:MAG: type III-B CRISPR module RAMP protein Cmr1 [Myxococcales bacterium]|nr:type III-B CRISPR module RAMP protein Cmr1 [Myxococcales bacterium]
MTRRNLPAAPTLPEAVPVPPDLVVDTRTYRFISYVFGGGVRLDGAKKPFDPFTPVRVPSVRGQLRFWWRACNPSRCETVDALGAREQEIFGGIRGGKTPEDEQTVRSKVEIRVVRNLSAPALKKVLSGEFGAEKGMEGLAYGAFPLRGEKENHVKVDNHGTLWHYGDREFELELRYPEKLRADVEAALWAWATFGGLGGRTRRGFGAIRQTAPGLPGVDDGWTKYVRAVGGEKPLWPRLSVAPSNNVRRLVPQRDAKAAHERLLKTLQTLRQGAGVGRERAFGRSLWPEPDALRRITGMSRPRHPDQMTRADVFPRAAFGLPITFRFKDQGDPPESTLVPACSQRDASTLLLRPYVDGNGTHALAVRLSKPPLPGGVTLDGRQKVLRVDVNDGDVQGLGRHSPLVRNGRVIDPISRYFEELSK